MRKLVLRLILIYQKYLPKSPLGCRFSPTCSEYTYQAISKYGILHGGFLGFNRLLKCHPWHPGGNDPLK
jgi:hypothetical protein